MFGFFKKKADPKNQIYAEIKQLNFEDLDTIKSLIKPIALLDIKNGIPKVGASKFGGRPDLPDASNWPHFKGKPMAFLGQINTGELSQVDCGFKSHKNGLISVFHYFERPDDEYGASYDYFPSSDTYAIEFFEAHQPLQRIDFPATYFQEYQFEEQGIQFVQSYQIPGTPEHSAVIHSALCDTDKNKLYDYGDQFMNLFESQIGGYPLPVQAGADMDWTSAKFPDLDYLSSVFLQQALKFENLLSFSFHSNFESIGDTKMYVGMTKEDLENLNFQNAVVIHQGT